MTRTRLTQLLLTLVAFTLFAASNADGYQAPSNSPSKPSSARERQNQPAPPDRDLLAGPKVEPEANGRGPQQMAGGQREQRRQRDIPLQQWIRILNSLELPPAQQSKVQSIMQDFRKAQEEFRKEHGEELRKVQQSVGPMERSENPQQAERPAVREARMKAEAIMQKAPKPEDFKRRIWQELTPEQQQQMKAKLEEVQKRLDMQRPAMRSDTQDRDQQMQPKPLERDSTQQIKPEDRQQEQRKRPAQEQRKRSDERKRRSADPSPIR